MHRFELHGTNVGSPFITDAPPLALEQAFDGLLRQLAAGHQGTLPFRALSVACRAAQPFEVFVLACPRPMHDVPFSGTMKVRTLWIRT
jgi:hypothetical protein